MKNNNIININKIAMKSYINTYENRELIYKENRNKSGIYCLYNKITNKFYVGSSINLSKRLKCYFSYKFIKKESDKYKSIIYNAIIKYNYNNFNLYILEYCNKDIILNREQYYIDLLKPEYNIYKIAVSHFNYKLSKETKEKIRNFANLRTGQKAAFYGKKHSVEAKLLISLKKSKEVKVTNIKTGLDIIFTGNKKAANYLNISLPSLYRYKKSSKLLEDKYLISNY